MILFTQFFTFFFTFLFILSASEFADARTTQKKGRNTIESEKRLGTEAASVDDDLIVLETSLTLRLLEQMKICIYAQLLEKGSMAQWATNRASIDFR